MRKDHFVPEAYLKGFVSSEGIFYGWKTEYRSILKCYPAQVCWEDHFYDLDSDLMKRMGATDPAILEHYAFKDFENEVQNIVKRLSNKPKQLPFDQLVLICRGYVLQKIRTPYYRKGIAELDKREGPQLKRRAQQSVRAELTRDHPRFAKIKDQPEFDKYFTDEYWEEIYKDSIKQKIDPKGTQHHSLIETVSGMSTNANDAVQRLLSMTLEVYNAPKDTYFITSDNPGFSLLRDGQLNSIRTHSFGFPTMLGIIYPISSKQAIHLSALSVPYTRPVARNIKYTFLSEDDVYRINRETHFHSDEKVFCCDREYLRTFMLRVAS